MVVGCDEGGGVGWVVGGGWWMFGGWVGGGRWWVVVSFRW